MEKYTLTKTDYEIIEKLIKISSSIYTIYKKIIQVEKSQSNEELSTLLDYLNMSIEIENKYYSEAKLDDGSKCQAYLDYMINRVENGKAITLIDSVIEDVKEELVIRRIINYLITIYSNSSIKAIVSLIEEVHKAGLPMKIDSKEVNSELLMTKLICSDFDKTFLSILENDLAENTTIPNLIDSKYLYIYADKELEEDLLKDNLTIPKTIVFNSKLVAEINGYDSDKYKEELDETGTKYAARSMNELLNITDNEYNTDDRVKAKVKLLEYSIRAGLLYVDEESLSSIIRAYRIFTIYGNANVSRITKYTMEKSFDDVETDRERVISIIFGAEKK